MLSGSIWLRWRTEHILWKCWCQCETEDKTQFETVGEKTILLSIIVCITCVVILAKSQTVDSTSSLVIRWGPDFIKNIQIIESFTLSLMTKCFWNICTKLCVGCWCLCLLLSLLLLTSDLLKHLYRWNAMTVTCKAAFRSNKGNKQSKPDTSDGHNRKKVAVKSLTTDLMLPLNFCAPNSENHHHTYECLPVVSCEFMVAG